MKIELIIFRLEDKYTILYNQLYHLNFCMVEKKEGGQRVARGGHVKNR